MDPLTRSYPWYTPYQFAGNKPIWAVDLDGLEEALTNGRKLIGVKVKEGWGPTQVAAWLNNPQTQLKFGYSLAKKVTWIDIIDQPRNNAVYFSHITKDRYNKNNPLYKKLNLNPEDALIINASNQEPYARIEDEISLKGTDEEIYFQTLNLMKKFSLENKYNGGTVYEPGKYKVTDFVNPFIFDKPTMLDYYTGKTGYPGAESITFNLNIDKNKISITFSKQRGNYLTVTHSDNYFNFYRITTFGLNYENPGGKIETRLIQINYGQNDSLYRTGLKYIMGENKNNTTK